MALQKDELAPVFKLYDSEKNEVSLETYRGNKNVLLLFFPLAFTSVCTKELCQVRDDINKYENEDTAVLGVSVDSVYALARYKEQEAYNFTLLSDFNKTVSTRYEVLYPSFGAMDLHGVSKRSAFIVDKQGKLAYAEVLENPGMLPDFVAIDKVLADLKG